MPDRVYFHGIWMPYFAVAISLLPFQLNETIKSARKAVKSPTRFSVLLLAQNVFAILLTAGQCVLLTEEYYPMPGNLLVNYSLGPSMLLHSALLLQWFGLFRVVIPWYTNTVQRVAVTATVLAHFLLFWPNYLQYVAWEKNYPHEGLFWIQAWMMYGTLVWALWAIAIDLVTSTAILRYLAKSRRLFAQFNPENQGRLLLTSFGRQSATRSAAPEKQDRPARPADDAQAKMTRTGAFLGAMALLDLVAMAFFLFEQDSVAITCIGYHFIFTSMFFALVTETVRPVWREREREISGLPAPPRGTGNRAAQ